MDGASKFVRGDAVAGILILVINVIGGLIIGMAQHGLSAGRRPTAISCWPWVMRWWRRFQAC
jgi:flagellar biosynthesis component FlhA